MALHDYDPIDVEMLNLGQAQQVLAGLLAHLGLKPVMTCERAGHHEPDKRRSMQFMDKDQNIVSNIYQHLTGIR